MAAIVRVAGTSRRTFYEHFDDLTDALIHVCKASACRLLEDLSASYGQSEAADDRLAAMLHTYVTSIATHADLAQVVHGEMSHTHLEAYRKTLSGFPALLARWAEDAYQARLILRAPDAFTVRATLSGIEGAAMQYVVQGESHRLMDPDVVPRLGEFVLRAFR